MTKHYLVELVAAMFMVLSIMAIVFAVVWSIA